jgi:hypothetical protein
MDARTQSGVPADEQFPPPSVVAMLGGGAALAVFALTCAERASMLVERLATSGTLRLLVRTALETGWAALVNRPDAEAVDRAILGLDEIRADRANLDPRRDLMEDSVAAVAYALEVVRDGDEIAAVNVATRCREIAFKLAEESWPTMSLEGLVASPVMQDEVLRQVRDTERLVSIEGLVSDSQAAELRAAARAEGGALIAAAGGEEPKRISGLEPVDQLPLF